MEKKEFIIQSEAETFVKSLLEEKKWMIDFYTKNDKDEGPWIVEWSEHKKYVSHTGETIHDEVWRTKDLKLVFVQDLSEEHCRNVLRKVLREERLASMAVSKVREQLDELFQSAIPPADNLEDPYHIPPDRVLH